MNAELYIKKEGNICYISAVYGSEVIAISDEFEYSWETLRKEISNMINFVKGMGFNVSETLP